MNEQAIFLAALDISDLAERAAYVEKACAGDSALARQVNALFAAHEKSGGFLDVPAVAQIAALPIDGTMNLEPPQGNQPVAKQNFLDTQAEPNDDDNGESVLHFLQPSDKPGSLGRLAQYEVLEILGKGGFGIVVRAFDEKLQRVVAIKIMSAQMAATSPPRKRFLREARASAKIRHENVVAIHDIHEEPIPYLVMEYIPGETLQKKLDRTGPFDVMETLRIGQQIAAGLAAAHAQGLIHRDIKPANILLESGIVQKVKITDFGLARAADDASLTQSGMIAGTPMYMAPEQAAGVALDHRADLFSFGSVMYVMCSGRPPFRAATTLAVLKRVAEDTPRPIREIIAEVPQWLCDVITKLHAKNPDERFESAQEVADVLGQYYAEMKAHGKVTEPAAGSGQQAAMQPTTSAPSSGETTLLAAPAVRRKRRWMPAAAALVLLALVGLGFTEATGVTNLVQGTIIRLSTAEGTLVVEVDDPDVSVTIDGEEIVIKGAGTKEIRVKAGQHKLLASKDGKMMRQTLVTVAKGGREVVRISREVIPPKQEKPSVPPALRRDYALLFDAKSKVGPLDVNLDLSEPFTIEAYLTADLTDARRTNNTAILCYGRVNIVALTKNDTIHWGFRLFGQKDDFLAHSLWFEGVAKQRTHVAGVFTGKDMHLFVDGKLVQSKHIEYDLPAKIRTSLNLGSTFTGSIDEMRVSKKARYDKDFTPLQRFEPDADTLALYHCDEGGGGLLKDSSGNEHDGKIVGAKWVKAEPNVAADPDRKAAEYVLSIGGKIQVNEQNRVLDNAADLPSGPIRLTYVYLRTNPQVNDAGLAELKNCKNLIILHLEFTQTTDAGLANLKNCPDLMSLNLGGAQITDAGLAHFKDCKKLIQFRLYGAPVTDAGLAYFKDCKNLTTLSLNGTKVSDAGLAHFKDCKDLAVLDLSNTQVSDAGMAHVNGCKKLTQLFLSKTKVTEAKIDELKKALPQCRIEWDGGVIEPTLVVDPDRRAAEWVLSVGGEIRVNGRMTSPIPNVGALPKETFRLTAVLMSNNKTATDVDFDVLKDCKHLTVLSLHGKTITDETVAPFKNCKSLTILALVGTSVGDAGMTHFKDCKSLASLELGNTNVGDAGLAHFKNCTNLTTLSLYQTTVSDASVAWICGLSKLKNLRIDATKMTPTGIETLRKALPGCRIVHHGGTIEPTMK